MTKKQVVDVQLAQQNHEVGAAYAKLEGEFIRALMKCSALEQKLKAVADGREELKEARRVDFEKIFAKTKHELDDLCKAVIVSVDQVQDISTQVHARQLISRSALEEVVHQMDVSYGNIMPSATDINEKRMAHIVSDIQKIFDGFPLAKVVATQDLRSIVEKHPQLTKTLTKIQMVRAGDKAVLAPSGKTHSSGQSY